MKRISMISLCFATLFFAKAQNSDLYYYKLDGARQEIKKNYNYLSVTADDLNTVKSAFSRHGFGNVRVDKIISKKSRNSNSTYFLVKLGETGEMQRVKHLKLVRSLDSYKNLIIEPVYGDKHPVASLDYFYVRLKNSKDLPKLIELQKNTGCSGLKKMETLPGWYKINITKNSTANSVELSNLYFETGLFSMVDPAFALEVEFSCSSEPEFMSQWNLESSDPDIYDVNLCQAWNYTKGAGVNVAVVDGGISTSFTELQNNLLANSFDCASGTSPSQSYNFHGEEVASIIAAEENDEYITGVAPEANIMDVTFAPTSAPTVTWLDEVGVGIGWAWLNGADVINNSWGVNTDFYPNLTSNVLESAINDALNNGRQGLGCVVVFASGNDYNEYDVRYPGNVFDDVLVVGASMDVGIRWGQSNYSPDIDLIAPGDEIMAVSSNFNLSLSSGTSMAAPHVSGVAALLISLKPCLSGKEVNDIIEQSANKIPGGAFGITYTYSTVTGRDNGTWNDKIGYGLLDAGAAVLLAQSCTNTNEIVSVDKTVSSFYECQPYTVQSGAVLTFQSGVNNLLCNSGGESHIIESGGTMIIEDGASLHLFKDDKIIIEDGGQLIIKNTQAGKGVKLNDANSSIQIHGTMRLDNNAVLTTNGKGFINVKETGTITFGTNASIDWDMQTKGALILGEEVNLEINPSSVNIRNGNIIYDGGISSLTINTNTLTLNNLFFGSDMAEDINALIVNTTDASITNTSFADFNNALTINAPFATPSTTVLDGVNFTANSNSGFTANEVINLQITNCNFTQNQTGIKLRGQTHGSYKTVVDIKNSTINNNEKGIDATGVYELGLSNQSNVSQNTTGIESSYSNIFLREQSTISNCNTGISALGGFASNDHNLITIGDIGCGYLINNSIGIYATNMLLDINAVGNNTPCPDCGIITNRFDGNNKIADLRYNTNPPSEIWVNGAYFGGVNPNNQQTGIYAYYISKGIKKIPVRVEESCNIAPFNCYCLPNTPTPPQPPLPDQALLAACKDPSTGDGIHEKYDVAYGNFKNKNYVDAQTKFENIAVIDYKNRVPKYPYGCEHLIRVSEILSGKQAVASFAIPLNPSEELNTFLIQANDGNTYRSRTKNKVNEGAKVSFYNAMGVLVYTTTTININEAQLDVSKISKGIYLVKIEEPNKTPFMDKIIVQ